jgi:hypothetical protein
MTSQQVRTMWGVEGEGMREREREQQINGVRDGVLADIETAWVRNGHWRN